MPSIRSEKTVPKPGSHAVRTASFIIVHYHLYQKAGHSLGGVISAVNRCLFKRYYEGVIKAPRIKKLRLDAQSVAFEFLKNNGNFIVTEYRNGIHYRQRGQVEFCQHLYLLRQPQCLFKIFFAGYQAVVL